MTDMQETTIRRERPEDYRETENTVREAFWNHFAPGCCEHYILHHMRSHADFVPGLDLVAVSSGRIIGCSACAKGRIDTTDGRTITVLTLGPIAVLPCFQRKGTGTQLIRHTAAAGREMGYSAILLCGDPAYYTRLGFVAASRFGIRTADGMFTAALHALELREGALDGAAGIYHESGAYSPDEAGLADFDRAFTPKEAVSGTPSQLRFQEIVKLKSER